MVDSCLSVLKMNDAFSWLRPFFCLDIKVLKKCWFGKLIFFARCFFVGKIPVLFAFLLPGLDALAHHWRLHGLNAMSVQWGPWLEVGMAVSWHPTNLHIDDRL